MNMQNKKIKFLFIVGTPRSGGSVTLGSLDGHPDILAWPYEFLYFPFFYDIAEGRDKVPLNELNEKLIKSFLDFFSKRLMHGDGLYKEKKETEKIDFNVGDFNFNDFLNRIRSTEQKDFNVVEYLVFLFECFKDSHKKYKEKEVKYYALLTGARGFDWHNKLLIESSRFLFSYRVVEDTYSSIREKQLKNNDFINFFSPFSKKSCLYWLETYRRISDVVERHSGKNNFFIIPLKDLQKNTDSLLIELCYFLELDVHSNIFSLTICGQAYKGNAHEGDLNQGKVAKRTSKTRFPLTSFEKRIFSKLNLYDFSNNTKVKYLPFNFISAVKYSYVSAFLEIKVFLNNIGYLNKYNFTARVIMLIYLLLIYISFNSDLLKMKFIRMKNGHMTYNPLWSSE